MGILGEQAYRVPSLSAPNPAQTIYPDVLPQYEAVRLFIERARQVRSDFAVSNRNASALAQLCFRLDGIPLAIELAAARVGSLSVEDMNTRQAHRFRLLTGGDRTALPRQQTLQALIDWSYDLLHERERLLLARLSVFAGEWTLEAAEYVCADTGVLSTLPATAQRVTTIDTWEVLELLTSLVDKSLVLAEDRDGRTRYRLLETVRQYAAEKLQTFQQTEQSKQRHIEYFLTLVETLEARFWGPEQVPTLQQLEQEHDNLRIALEWCGQAGLTEAGLRMTGVLWWFWMVRSYFSEGREHLLRALKEADSLQIATRAKAQIGLGCLAYVQGDYSESCVLSEESLQLCREIGDDSGIAWSLQNLGNLALNQGDYKTADAFYAQSLQIFQDLGDRHGAAVSLQNLGNVAYSLNNFSSARDWSEKSLALCREAGDQRSVASSLHILGSIATFEGDYASARQFHREALGLRRAVGYRRGIAASLDELAAALFGLGETVKAVQLWAAADALRTRIGAHLSAKRQERYQQRLSAARATLDCLAFNTAWSAGQTMPWEEAVALALSSS
jgi:non-specific serine/threonine protein kinase